MSAGWPVKVRIDNESTPSASSSFQPFNPFFPSAFKPRQAGLSAAGRNFRFSNGKNSSGYYSNPNIQKSPPGKTSLPPLQGLVVFNTLYAGLRPALLSFAPSGLTLPSEAF